MRRPVLLSIASLSALDALLVSRAFAAETYWQPIVEARIEGNTNRDLLVSAEDPDNSAGYLADVALVYGVATPRSETEIRPRLRLQDFSNVSGVERTEEFLDLRSVYRSLRGQANVIARYSRRDAYTAEIAGAGFDDFDPADPTRSETGLVRANNRRTQIQVRPGFTYRVTERQGFTGGVTFETVDYETEDIGRQVDFDYTLANLGWFRDLDERTSLSITPQVSRYEARDDSSKTDAYGLAVAWERKWSEILTASFSVTAERNESELLRDTPTPIDENSTEWGALLGLDRTNEANRWRLSAGRIITPSGSGTKATSDEINLQYDRDMSPRLLSTVALRGQRVRSLSDVRTGDDRDYARLRLQLRWAMTPTWYISGGYEFTYREFKNENDDANNNAVFMTLRYEGLGRQSQ